MSDRDRPIELEVLGDPDAAVCVDGICEVPGSSPDEETAPDVMPPRT